MTDFFTKLSRSSSFAYDNEDEEDESKEGVSRRTSSGRSDNYSESFESDDQQSEITVYRKPTPVKIMMKKPQRRYQRIPKYPPPNNRINNMKANPTTDIEKKIRSVRKMHNDELRNMNGELLLQVAKQKEEIRLLKRMEVRQTRAIEEFDGNKNRLPVIIDAHNREMKVLREQLRDARAKYRKCDAALRETDAELERTRNRLNKFKALLEEEQLIDRAELTRKLTSTQHDLEESRKKIQTLQNHTEHLLNNHKHELNIERTQNKKLKMSFQNLQEKFSQMELQLLEKGKELEVWNIYSNRQKAGGSKLNGSFNTPRSTPSVRNKFNEKIPPLTPPSHRIKRYEEARKQRQTIKKPQDKQGVKNFSVGNEGDKKNTSAQDFAYSSVMSSTEAPSTEQDQQKHSILDVEENLPPVQNNNSKQEKETKLPSDKLAEELAILLEPIGKRGKQMETVKNMVANDSRVFGGLERDDEIKLQEELPPKTSEREAADVKQEEDRKKKDLLLARLREIDNNTEMALDIDRIFAGDNMAGKTNNQSQYTFSKMTENLHHGRPAYEKGLSDRKNSPSTKNKYPEKLSDQNDFYSLMKNGGSLEELLESNLTLAYDKANRDSAKNGAAGDLNFQKKSIGNNKHFNEILETSAEDNLPNNIISFQYNAGNSIGMGPPDHSVWDMSSMLRGDSILNNDKHSSNNKLLPARHQMTKFDKRSALNSLENSMDSVEEIIL
ncbi:lebercilin-like protein [Argonauta hians]